MSKDFSRKYHKFIFKIVKFRFGGLKAFYFFTETQNLNELHYSLISPYLYHIVKFLKIFYRIAK